MRMATSCSAPRRGAFEGRRRQADDPRAAAVEDREHEDEMIPDVTGAEEMAANVLMALLAHAAGEPRMGQEQADSKRGALGRVHEEAGDAVDHLRGDAADGAGDHGLALP